MIGKKANNSSRSTDLEQSLESLIRPFQQFIHNQKTGSLLLLASTATALLIANSPFLHLYEELIKTPIGLLLGSEHYAMSLHHWINDGLMALFFFVIGLEIKREMLAGDLREPANALPVIAAAVGGMIVPALIFYSLNAGSPTVQGWAIPMATDTAFAIGLLSLLGRRIPFGLISFILALAIIDDIGAVMVIALFYSESLSQPHMLAVIALIALLVLSNRAGVRHPLFYFFTGGLVWLAMLGTGIHATLAGILVAFTIPARPAKGSQQFIPKSIELLKRFREYEKTGPSSTILEEPKQHELVEDLNRAVEQATTPLQRWEQRLERPVAILVLPIFALVNAGIAFSFDSLGAVFTSSLSLGIILGLVLGKFIGICSFTWLALKLGWGELPGQMSFRHLPGLALIAGIGFTMSVFIASLGFSASPEQLTIAKTGIIFASLLAGLSGFTWLYALGKADAAQS